MEAIVYWLEGKKTDNLKKLITFMLIIVTLIVFSACNMNHTEESNAGAIHAESEQKQSHPK